MLRASCTCGVDYISKIYSFHLKKIRINPVKYNELNITYSRNFADHTREDPSEELAVENAKLRAENQMLKEFIKNELEKITKTMELNMQQTIQKVESKASLLETRTQSFRLSLERVANTSAATAADNRRLRDEAKQHHDSALQSSHSEEVKALSEAVTQSKAELKDALGKVAAFKEEAEKKEVKNLELRRSNDELQRENQGLQRQLHEIKTTPRTDVNAPNASPRTSPSASRLSSSHSSPPVTLTPRTEDSSAKQTPKGEKEQDGANKSPPRPKSIPITPPVDGTTPRGDKATPRGGGITPRGDGVTPRGDGITPRGDEVTPRGDIVTKGGPGVRTPRNRTAGLSGEQLRIHNIIVVQSLVRRWLGKRLAKCALRRRTVANELITTERTYVACLQTLLSEYFQPLRKMASEGQPLSQTLNENLLKTIFNNAEVIYNINSNLLTKLEQRWSSWDYDQKLGDVFLSTMEFLKCYNQYVNHYNRSLDTLAECAKITAFMDFLKLKGVKCGHHLRDLLIVPVQRIPRYVILLEEMVRYTHKTHPDFKELTLALSKMHNIADYVNEKKRDFESLAQVSAIQETLVGISILEYPRLRFLLEGDLVFEGGKKTQQYHVFLFNEVVLCTKLQKKVFGDRKQKQLKYKFLELIKLSVDTRVSKSDCAFAIDVPNTPSKKFLTTTEKDRDLWVQNLQSSIDKMVEAKKTKSVDRM